MPSKKRHKTTSHSRSKSSNKKKTRRSRKKRVDHQLFWPLVILVFVIWVLYRYLFSFSVLFDELIGKALFFAFPVLIYINVTNWSKIIDTFSPTKFRRGLLVGLGVGGIFGFAAVILSMLGDSGLVVPTPYYQADYFAWEFFLAILTGFFETFFFFSFIQLVIEDRYRSWSAWRQVSLVALIFLLFHLPNLIINFSGTAIIWQMILLFSLAYGEALFFKREQNAYMLVLIQAIWGMVLLLYF